MRTRSFVVALASMVLLPLVAVAQPAAPKPFTLDDHGKVRVVNDPQRSPDGAWVAYTVASIDVEKDKRNTDVWMVSWDGATHVQLTSSPDGESRPRWSPDGKFLAFLASRGDEDEKKKGAQVWLLNRSGGEAVKLTSIDGGVSDYAWSPDSTRLALIVNDKDPNDEPEKKEGWKRKAKPPIEIDRYHFKQDVQGYLARLYSRVAVFDIATKKHDVLTKGDVDDEAPAWSPDGTKIAFLSKRAAADPDRTTNDDLWVVEARAGAEPKRLTTTPEDEAGRPAWSPDGTRIAILVTDEDKWFAYTLAKLAVVPAAGGTPTILTPTLDRPVEGAAWTADGTSIMVSVDDDRASYLLRVPAAGGAPEKLAAGRHVVGTPSVGKDGGIAMLVSTTRMPAEVHAFEKGALRKLSAQNDAWIKEMQFGIVEELTSTSRDGTDVHSLLTKPAGYVAGQKYPTVLYIHGGPNAQDDWGFSFDREFFAANGYVVIEVNYRGSSGRGAAYQRAIFGDWGNKEVLDLLGAVDAAVAKGIADPAKLGLGGWSYGGILTNYTIATDPRFKAAVSGAGSSLQLGIYGIDQYVVQYDIEMGQPWKHLERWMKVSYPFFQGERISTPTLFMGGESDFNVPIAGSEQMYQMLRSRGVTTKLVIYPGQFHGLTVPSYQRDKLQRYLGWWDTYLKK